MSASKEILYLCDASDTDVVNESFANHQDYVPVVETFEKILRFGVLDYLEETIGRLKKHPELYAGIVGIHDSSAVLAAIIAQETGKNFIPVEAVINCQNKYLSRCIQKQVLPEATPDFAIALDYLRNLSQIAPPFFIKPARSNISFATHRVESQKDLENFITLDCIDIARYNQCYLNALSRRSSYYNALNIATCNIFLCEELIEGVQVTVDGFVFKGHVKFFGITKANYHSNSNIFFYHSFPYTFSPELSKKIEQGLSRLIPGLGLENGFFNVELRANEKDNTYKIIEVNSRIAFQFAKTIQAVKGFDPLHLQCDLAVGKYPDLSSTSQRCFRYCYNFELHSFEDARIAQTPTQSAYAELRLKYPEVYIRNLVHEGANLSDFKHNPDSYRYCVLDIPGDSHTEIMDKYEDVVSRLGYKFSPSEPGSDPAMDYPPKTPLSTDQREAVQPCTQPAPSRL